MNWVVGETPCRMIARTLLGCRLRKTWAARVPYEPPIDIDLLVTKREAHVLQIIRRNLSRVELEIGFGSNSSRHLRTSGSGK
jgi:hypothetical protein